MARPTLDTIAKMAGVSPSTVSLVLNEKGNIGEETRARIKEIIYTTGYRRMPNSRLLGLVGKAPDAFILATRQAAAEYGYDLAVLPDEAGLSAHRDEPVGGVIVYGGQWEPTSLDRISEAYSTVLLGAHTRATTVDSIWVDNADGIYQAVNHLLDRGHRCIGLVNGPKNTTTSWEKQVGFDRALTLAKTEARGVAVSSASFSRKDSRQAALTLLAQEPQTSALIVSETKAGIAVHQLLHEQGLLVPDDMSLIVFHDDPDLLAVNPPITAIGFSYLDIARETLARLVRRMTEPTAQSRRILFKPFIIERDSVRSRW